MPDVETLHRRYLNAMKKHSAAAKSVNKAKEKYLRAKFVETGLEGHRVSFFSLLADGTTHETFFLAESVSGLVEKVQGHIIMADGSLGTKVVCAHNVKDHGIYEL